MSDLKSNSSQENELLPERKSKFPFANFNFSTAELEVIKECKRESFYQRSLPLSGILGLGAYLGVKNGFLKPNNKYGAIPKVLIFMTIGYFAGKFSYRHKCAEKLMALPDSRLAEILKQKKINGNLYGCWSPGFGASYNKSFNDCKPRNDEAIRKE